MKIPSQVEFMSVSLCTKQFPYSWMMHTLRANFGNNIQNMQKWQWLLFWYEFFRTKSSLFSENRSCDIIFNELCEHKDWRSTWVVFMRIKNVFWTRFPNLERNKARTFSRSRRPRQTGLSSAEGKEACTSEIETLRRSARGNKNVSNWALLKGPLSRGAKKRRAFSL